MKRSLPWVLALVVLTFLCASGGSQAQGSGKDLPGFLEGDYGLIGKKPGSDETYSGTVRIRQSGNKLEVLRCAGSSRLAGEGSIVSVTSDRIPNLKVRWRDGKNEYEGRYQINGDSDNYARLSGPYVLTEDQTKFGWELFYVDRDGGPVCR